MALCCMIQVNLDMTDHCTTDFLHMMDDMLGPSPSPMHIKYSSYVYDRLNAYDGPIFLVPLIPSYPSSPVIA